MKMRIKQQSNSLAESKQQLAASRSSFFTFLLLLMYYRFYLMSTDELLSLLGSGDPASVQSHIIKVSVLHFNFDFRSSYRYTVPYCVLSIYLCICIYSLTNWNNVVYGMPLLAVWCDAMHCGILFQMFENIKTLRLETNLNGMIVIKGMVSTEGEFLQFQDEGL